MSANIEISNLGDENGDERATDNDKVKEVPSISKVDFTEGNNLENSFDREDACEGEVHTIKDLGDYAGLAIPGDRHDRRVHNDADHDEPLESIRMSHLVEISSAFVLNGFSDAYFRLELKGHQSHGYPLSLS